MPRTITPEWLYQRLTADEDVRVIDTRPADDFAGWHIPGAENVPFRSSDKLDPSQLQGITVPAEGDLVTVCAKGIGSYAFAEQAVAHLDQEPWVLQDGMEGWSRLYDVLSVPTAATDLEIYQFQRVAKGCLSYLVGGTESHEAVVIDPTRHVDEFQRAAADDHLSITAVIDTHVHADHLSGGRALADAVDATYYLPGAAADRDVDVQFEPLDHLDVLSIGRHDLKAIHTPGHTTDSTSLLLDAEAVFTGDTLFTDSVGRTELQFGDANPTPAARKLFQSVRGSLLTLPDPVTALPGHHRVPAGEALMTNAGTPVSTTIEAIRTDTQLMGEDEDAFAERITDNLPETPPSYARIVKINVGAEAMPGDDDATTIELGPNRCAAEAD